MKNLLFVIFCWMLAFSTLWAQDSLNPDQNQAAPAPKQTPGKLPPDQRWVEQIDGSFAIPSFTTTVKPDPGLGGDINIGYRFNKNLALFIGSGYYQYSIPAAMPAASAQLAYIPLVGILRLTFGEGPFHPYVFGGAGIALNTYTQTNAPGNPILKTSGAETDFYLAPGLGILYRFSSDMAFFLQSRVDLDFTSSNGLGIPLADPSIFIPLQAGISFFAL
jgi:hypothetical protein